MAIPAVPLAGVVPADGRVLAGSRPVAVTVTGRYDAAHEFLVPGREQAGAPATYVVTPLAVADGRAVVVLRGWYAAGGGDGGGSTPAPPAGEVTVTGWLVPSEPLDASSIDPLSLPEGYLATVTVARIAGQLGYPVVDGYVGAVAEEPTSGAAVRVAPLQRVEVPQVQASIQWSMQSLFYAFEWWFFALVVIWMWAQAYRLEKRRLAEDMHPSGVAQAAVPPPAG